MAIAPRPTGRPNSPGMVPSANSRPYSQLMPTPNARTPAAAVIWMATASSADQSPVAASGPIFATISASPVRAAATMAVASTVTPTASSRPVQTSTLDERALRNSTATASPQRVSG